MSVISARTHKISIIQSFITPPGLVICDMMSLFAREVRTFAQDKALTLQRLGVNFEGILRINRRPGNIDLMSQNQMLRLWKNMPICIRQYADPDEKGQRVDWLCSDDWELPSQVESLEEWLLQNQDKIKPGKYVADIGFSPREGACGGGGVVSVRAMKIMVALGMELYLSEYPEFEGDE